MIVICFENLFLFVCKEKDLVGVFFLISWFDQRSESDIGFRLGLHNG